METIAKVLLTLLLCVLFPVAVLLDLLLAVGSGGGFTEDLSQKLRAIWTDPRSSDDEAV